MGSTAFDQGFQKRAINESLTKPSRKVPERLKILEIPVPDINVSLYGQPLIHFEK